MDIFGIGPLELILVLILALLVFGPNKLPEIAAKLSSSLRDMRKATREFSKELDDTREALQGITEPIKEIAAPLQTTGEALKDAREFVGNPGKAIEGYVMGQYTAGATSSEAAAATTAPPVEPAATAETPAPGMASALATLETAFAPAADTSIVEEVAAPVEETAAPVEEVAAPIEEIAAPVEETAAPVEEVAAPVEETAAPVEEIAAPVEETAAPVEDRVETPPATDPEPVSAAAPRSRHRAAPKRIREADAWPDNASALPMDGPAPQD